MVYSICIGDTSLKADPRLVHYIYIMSFNAFKSVAQTLKKQQVPDDKTAQISCWLKLFFTWQCQTALRNAAYIERYLQDQVD